MEYIIRLAVAALLGGIIGLEREYRAKEAGFRTHFLVALGSALFMILSQYGFFEVLKTLGSVASYDPSRIASQVVTGIGFIGAGTIILQKRMVRGLTTAAGLWVTSAIGMTVGAGMYVLAVASTVLVLLCLEALNYLHNHFGWRNIAITFSSASRESIRKVLEKVRQEEIDVDSYSYRKNQSGGEESYTIVMEIKVRRANYLSSISEFMAEFDGVQIDTIE